MTLIPVTQEEVTRKMMVWGRFKPKYNTLSEK
jgi:hypothetical protein